MTLHVKWYHFYFFILLQQRHQSNNIIFHDWKECSFVINVILPCISSYDKSLYLQIVPSVLYFLLKIQRFEIMLTLFAFETRTHVLFFSRVLRWLLLSIYLNLLLSWIVCGYKSNKRCFNYFRMNFCWHSNIFHEANKDLVESRIFRFSRYRFIFLDLSRYPFAHLFYLSNFLVDTSLRM